MTNRLWVSLRTVFISLFTSYDSSIMSQFQDRILSSFYAIWLIDYASAPGPYTFHIYIYDSSIIRDRILSQDRILFSIRPYTFKFWGPYTFADRIVSVKRPYSFRKKTVYFQLKDRILSVRTVYFTSDPLGSFYQKYLMRIYEKYKTIKEIVRNCYTSGLGFFLDSSLFKIVQAIHNSSSWLRNSIHDWTPGRL